MSFGFLMEEETFRLIASKSIRQNAKESEKREWSPCAYAAPATYHVQKESGMRRRSVFTFSHFDTGVWRTVNGRPVSDV